MAYSDRLNGYWEEGYHYYMEFRDEKLTMREYRRKVVLETTVTYDAEALDRGEETEIIPAEAVFSRWPDGDPAMEIRSLRWADGELKLLEYYTIMGEKEYTLHKTERGPFGHLRIRDEEVLPGLRGLWREWKPKGGGRALVIEGNSLTWEGVGGGRIHAVSYNYAPEKIWLVPEDLTESGFGAFSNVEVRGNMLVTGLIVMDMSMPASVFAREAELDAIEVPEAAKAAPRSTMGPAVFQTSGPMTGFLRTADSAFDGLTTAAQARRQAEKPRYCPECGAKVLPGAKFCSECGRKQDEGKGRYCPHCGHELEKEDLKFCTECGNRL